MAPGLTGLDRQTGSRWISPVRGGAEEDNVPLCGADVWVSRYVTLQRQAVGVVVVDVPSEL